ncbi:PASTA domain-containing protein [Candidatus Hydrogenedentota bacterium]
MSRGFFRRTITSIITICVTIVITLAITGAAGYLVMRHIIAGNDPVQVPSVLNKDMADAFEELEKAGLDPVRESSKYHDHVAKGLVISQNPPSRSTVKKGRDVKLVISLGSRRLKVPNLVRTHIKTVNNVLVDAKLSKGHLSYMHHDSVPRNLVIGQDPHAGSIVTIDRSVDFLVSLGPESLSFVMPKFVGLDLAVVQSMLGEMGIHDYHIQNHPDSERQVNLIIGQKPEANEIISQDGKVVVTRISTPVIEEFRHSIVMYTLPPGILSKRISIDWVDKSGEWRTAFDKMVRPGEQIHAIIKHRGKLRVEIYVNDLLVPEMSR